jgi:hypothetical protein
MPKLKLNKVTIDSEDDPGREITHIEGWYPYVTLCGSVDDGASEISQRDVDCTECISVYEKIKAGIKILD